MGKPAAIPFFGDAYLADTTHLTTEEHGAYFLLLLAAWRQEDCGLPADDKKLARITGLTTRKWVSVRDTILAFWFFENGRIYQPRLLKEWRFACKKSETNRKSAEARWSAQPSEKQQYDQCERISERNAPPPPPIIEEPNGSSIATRARQRTRASGTNPREQETNPRSTGRNPRKAPVPDIAVPEWVPREQWDAFIDMRVRKGKPPTARALHLLIGTLIKLRDGGHDPGAVLDQSTLKNWTDLYKIEDDYHGKTNQRGFTGYNGSRDTRDGFARALDDELAGHAQAREGSDLLGIAADPAGRYDAGEGGGDREPTTGAVVPLRR